MNTIKVTIDTREKPQTFKQISDKLTKFKNLECISSTLKAGDIEIIVINNGTTIKRYLIERKTYSDMSSSIRDDRIVEQCIKLKEQLVKDDKLVIYYLLEESKLSSHDFDYHTILQALINKDIRDGFHILRSFSLEDTAETIYCIVNAIYQNFSTKNITQKNSLSLGSKSLTHGKKKLLKAAGPHEFYGCLLYTVPGMSKERVKAIRSKYKTFIDLFIELLSTKDTGLSNITNILNNNPLAINICKLITEDTDFIKFSLQCVAGMSQSKASLVGDKYKNYSLLINDMSDKKELLLSSVIGDNLSKKVYDHIFYK